MTSNNEREQQILDAAAAVIIRLGYDKTTMSDIAAESGASRRTVYLYFRDKEYLFEALLYREYLRYAQTWLDLIEADPRGGTVGGFYRATHQAVNCHPLIAAMLRRDRRVVGSYLRKRDSLFAQMYSGVNTPGFFQALQAAGAIRQDIDPAVILHIIEMLSYGQLTIGDFKPPDQFPPYDTVMDTLADMMDRALAPQAAANSESALRSEADLRNEGASRSEAGKAIVRQITVAARAQLEQIKQTREGASSEQRTPERGSQGATNDNR